MAASGVRSSWLASVMNCRIRRSDAATSAQRALDVVEQAVQRVADEADLRARIGVPAGTRGRDRVVVAV